MHNNNYYSSRPYGHIWTNCGSPQRWSSKPLVELQSIPSMMSRFFELLNNLLCHESCIKNLAFNPAFHVSRMPIKDSVQIYFGLSLHIY